ncbi:polyprenyl synthetase family protein [Polynucleobacter kasalickyi]|uniref:Farnesyl diphosphate synthase n=1 Tax=Polynucleobacter kasalickyi TaxID=1938817 RepID=A0A1W1YGC9_9BURK|nr:farnesyl diphosphate synthase [Polynucleobacter kasalickyi]SMC34818.1 farnesyl diphosphate synthase [Polynucleobacter kasalickyi]
MFDWKEWHSRHLERIEQALKTATPSGLVGVERLESAMSYAVLAGGKRIRPLIIYATFELAHADIKQKMLPVTIDQVGTALELIHTYSLVHDDLPAMDNDDFRRGKPTTHKVYDEATALLVGDALQAFSFQILSALDADPQVRIDLIKELSFSAGVHGMCGGQAIDLSNVGRILNLEQLIQMHQLKTGALLRAAIRMGAILAKLNADDKNSLDQFARDVGLGFQVTDDILDATQNSETLGKTAGKDAQNNKPTFVSFMGLIEAKSYAEDLLNSALKHLSHFGEEAEPLRKIAYWAFQRKS